MAVDGRNLRRLVPAFLECLLLLHVIGYVPSVKGRCIWYGVCAKELEVAKKNCVYSGPAKPVQEETRNILEKYCPQFATGPVCCGNDQLNNLKMNIALTENILARCPSCMDNFMQHICGMTCSPNQSDFINPVSVEQFNSSHWRVKEINYHLSTTYKEATFNSCQEVPIPETPEISLMALDLMCGDHGAANCTANRLFQFLGDSYSNPYVPFQINFVGGDEPLDGYIPYNPSTRQREFNEQGCQKIEPPRKDAKGQWRLTTVNDTTIPNKSASENNSTVLNKPHNLTKFNTTENNQDKTDSCTFNCDMLYRLEQRKLQVEEDYYNFKKDYLKQKLVLLSAQTEAFKDIARKMPWPK